MDTPAKSVPAASTSSPNAASQFQDSPVFKYINNLSPIKPLNSEHSFNLLNFASPRTPITSPATNCLQKSEKTCSQLSYSVKHEVADGENEVRETQVIDSGTQPIQLLAGKAEYLNSSYRAKNNSSGELSKSGGDASQFTNDDPGISLIENDGKQDYMDSGIMLTVGSAPNEPSALSIEPQQCISKDHGGPHCKAEAADDLNNSVSQTVDSEISPEFFIQVNSVNGESSFNSNLALQGLQLHQIKGLGCRWEKMVVGAANEFLCDSPIDEGNFQETENVYVDSETSSFIENVLQPSEENINELLNMESIPLDSFEQHEVKAPFPHPNGAEKHSEAGQASTGASIADNAIPNSHAEVYNAPSPEPEQVLPRRCLVFELSGTNYRKIISEAGGPSLMSKQSACTAVTSEKRLLSSKCEVHDYSSLVPGIGLHLNTLARREKIVVKQEVSTYKRQLISIPSLNSSIHSTSRGSEPIRSALDIDPMQKDLELSNNEGKLKENANQSSEYTGSEELEENSTKRTRGKSEKAEDDTCKRCNCKRSKCLKLYCECFAAGLYCVDPCTCQGCLNKPAFEETVMETRRLIESRNPLAFAPKVVRFPDASEHRDQPNKTPASARHKRGCNCKKSGCLKKYCECFQGGVGCSVGCRCEGCRNSFGRKDGADNIQLEINEATEDNSADEAFPEAVLNVDMEAEDSQVTPSSQITSNQSGLVGLDTQFPSFSSHLLHPCTNQVPAKKTYFSCNDTLGVPSLRKIEMNIEDETAGSLRDEHNSLSSVSVKSVSPNSKRILPHLGPRHSPPRKFCRKLILRSIPSFPKLPDNREMGLSQEKPY